MLHHTLSPDIYKEHIARKATRDGFGEGLVAVGKNNPHVVVLTGDLKESTRVEGFAQAYPERFIECGVAEQNMLGVAAGLAQEGKIPFVASYAVFSPGRNWDQLRVSVAYNAANVKIIGGHTGVSVGADGATHQALEDIAITRVLPGLTVLAPCDALEAEKMVAAAVEHVGPVYIRLTRPATPVMTTKETPFAVGRGLVVREGRDITFVACGPLLYEALLAAEELAKKHVSVRVINMLSIKPIDTALLLAAARETRGIVTIEEHQITGGLGSAVAEFVSAHQPTHVLRVGMPDVFGKSGEPAQLLDYYGMTVEKICEQARVLLSLRDPHGR